MTKGEKIYQSIVRSQGEGFFTAIGRKGGSRPKPKGPQGIRVLTPEQIREIHTRWLLGNVSQRRLALEYKVSRSTVRSAIRQLQK